MTGVSSTVEDGQQVSPQAVVNVLVHGIIAERTETLLQLMKQVTRTLVCCNFRRRGPGSLYAVA